MLQGPVVYCGLRSGLWHMRWRNFNTQAEKSEQKVFAQISLSKY